MSADQHENVPVENKIPEEEEEEEDKGTSRLEIVKDFCRYMDVIQGPGVGVRASPLHGLILFGKLQSFAMESRSVLEDALVSFNPINYLRKEYRAQDWRKASGFYDEYQLFRSQLGIVFNLPVSQVEDFTLRHFKDGLCLHCDADSEGDNPKARFIHIVKGCEAYGGGDASAALIVTVIQRAVLNCMDGHPQNEMLLNKHMSLHNVLMIK